MKDKDIGELHKKWNRQSNIITVLIATAIGLSIALALGLLAVFGPK